jgi:hypothetical protein
MDFPNFLIYLKITHIYSNSSYYFTVSGTLVRQMFLLFLKFLFDFDPKKITEKQNQTINFSKFCNFYSLILLSYRFFFANFKIFSKIQPVSNCD